jgi:hypothetical protein
MSLELWDSEGFKWDFQNCIAAFANRTDVEYTSIPLYTLTYSHSCTLSHTQWFIFLQWPAHPTTFTAVRCSVSSVCCLVSSNWTQPFMLCSLSLKMTHLIKIVSLLEQVNWLFIMKCFCCYITYSHTIYTLHLHKDMTEISLITF